MMNMIKNKAHTQFLLAKAYFGGSRKAAAYYSLLEICEDPIYELEDKILAHLMLARLYLSLSLEKTSQKYLDKTREIIKNNFDAQHDLAIYYELKCLYEESRIC